MTSMESTTLRGFAARAALLAATVCTVGSASAQIPVTPGELSELRKQALEMQQELAGVITPRAITTDLGVVRPMGISNDDISSRVNVDLYVGLQPGFPANGFWRFDNAGAELVYWALDDGKMAPPGIGGARVNEYEFSFGMKADFAGDTIRPYVIVSFYNAPLDPVAGATNPVVEPPTPVHSFGWVFNPITLPAPGFYSVRSGLIDLAMLGLDFDMDETYYVEILPLEWSGFPGGAPSQDPDVHAVFTGPGTVTFGTNQSHMWSDLFRRNAACARLPSNLDTLYQHPAEMDVCNDPLFKNQSGIILRGEACAGANQLRLRIDDPADLCVQPGEQIKVVLDQSCLPGLVRGYQAFLSFDPTKITFNSGSYLGPLPSSSPLLPYGLPILTPVSAVGGNIDLAAGINNLIGQTPTSTSADLVEMTFTAGAMTGFTTVAFRANVPPTRFSDPIGNPVAPTLVDAPTICVDGNAPTLVCVPINLNCIDDVPAAATTAAEFILQGGTAFDVGCSGSFTFTFLNQTDNGGSGCVGNPLVINRDFQAEDCAGNISTCTQVITVEDNVLPLLTTGSINACYADVASAEAAALAATSATDNCTATIDLTVGVSTVGTCSAVVTVTFTDECGNVGSHGYNTRIDGDDPVVTAGSIAACYPDVASAEAAALAATTIGDVCTVTPTVGVSTVGTCSAVVTVTATDECGNDASVSYNTRIDGDDPVVTAGSIAACYPDVASAEAAALAATTVSDVCTVTPTVAVSTVGTCSAVVTVTATDECGNDASVSYNTRIDGDDPVVTAGSIAACYPDVASAEAAALAATTISDVCTVTPTVGVSTVGTCSAVVTVTATDECGNDASVSYNTRIDGDDPVVTAGSIAACYPDVASAEAAALAATTVSDVCTAVPTVVVSTVGTCSAVITVTATDECGNDASVSYNTRIDGDDPVVTAGSIAACYPDVASAEAAALAATTVSDVCTVTPTVAVSTVGTCSAVVTVTATDECGNDASVSYNTRIDGDDPVVTAGSIAACYPDVASAEAAALAATTVSDVCTVTPTVGVSTVGTCSAVVTVTATDECGNDASVSYNTRIDGDDPVVTAGSIAACYPDVASAEAAALAATTISDVCTVTPTVVVSTVGTCSAVVTVTATDECGNDASVSYNTRIDGDDPVVTAGSIAACYPDVASAEAAALAATTISDVCTVTPTVGVSTVGTCSAVVTVTATDECGNTASVSYNTRIDGTAPVGSVGSNISVNADDGFCTALVTWSAATSIDNCPGALTGPSYDIDLNDDMTIDATQAGTSYTFPAGTHRVIASFTDGCGNVGSASFTVTVAAINDIAVTVQFQWPFNGSRCVTFELWNCAPPVGPIVIQQVMTFTAGIASGTLSVPCGQYTCLTARDRLHTLRQTDSTLLVGPNYVADFTGPNRLFGGNLNDDQYIDILDFGVYALEFGTIYATGADTTCATLPPHADITGSFFLAGLVFTEDFAFIQINFLLSHAPNCCGAALLLDGPDNGPIDSITVEELDAMGLGHLRPADLNDDGVLDTVDMVAFSMGARPRKPVTPLTPETLDENATVDPDGSDLEPSIRRVP